MVVSVYEVGRGTPVDACLAIAQALPDYFTASALPHLRDDLTRHTTYVVHDQERRGVIGFAVVARKNAAVAELLWLAVDRASQGQGHGSALLAAVEERTRHFYERAGFVHLETVDPYSGWEPGNPCAIYVKILTPATTL